MMRDLLCIHCDTRFQVPDRPGRRDAFCPGCGALLPVLSGDQQLEALASRGKCTVCGELIPPGMDRCIICGVTTSPIDSPEPSPDNGPISSQVWLIACLAFLPLIGFLLCPPVGFLPILPCGAVGLFLAWNNLRAIAGGRLPPKHRWLIIIGGVVAGLEVIGTILVFAGYFVNI